MAGCTACPSAILTRSEHRHLKIAFESSISIRPRRHLVRLCLSRKITPHAKRLPQGGYVLTRLPKMWILVRNCPIILTQSGLGRAVRLPLTISSAENRIGVRLRHLSLFFRIRDLRRHDFSIEGERCLVEIVERHGRAEVTADVEAVVGGEGKSGGDRHPALRHDLTIDP
jgi:hypothetical protein